MNFSQMNSNVLPVDFKFDRLSSTVLLVDNRVKNLFNIYFN